MSPIEVALYRRTNFDKMGDIMPRQTNERFVVGCVRDFPCEFCSSPLRVHQKMTQESCSNQARGRSVLGSWVCGSNGLKISTFFIGSTGMRLGGKRVRRERDRHGWVQDVVLSCGCRPSHPSIEYRLELVSPSPRSSAQAQHRPPVYPPFSQVVSAVHWKQTPALQWMQAVVPRGRTWYTHARPRFVWDSRFRSRRQPPWSSTGAILPDATGNVWSLAGQSAEPFM